jgi:hypothetical protein
MGGARTVKKLPGGARKIRRPSLRWMDGWMDGWMISNWTCVEYGCKKDGEQELWQNRMDIYRVGNQRQT